MNTPKPSHVIILILLSLVLYFPRLDRIDFWNQHEVWYAEISREMLAEGQWLIPHYNGDVYTNKPPLFFWSVALISKLSGDVNEITARLPSALAALGMVLVTYFLGKRLYGPRTGLMAALILASSSEFFTYARLARMDIPFAFFTTAAMAAFYWGYTGTSHRARWFSLFWLMLALALLTKGPLVTGLPLAAVFFYLLKEKNLRFMLNTDFLLTSAVFLAGGGAWFVLAHQGGPGDYMGSFIYQNVALYLQWRLKDIARLHFYFQKLLLGTAPWGLLLPVVFYLYFRRKAKEDLNFPAIWALAMFGLCNLLIAKRHAHYLFPLYPPVAILVAYLWNNHFTTSNEPWSKKKVLAVYSLSLLCGFAIPFVNWQGSLLVGLAGIALGILLCLFLFRTRQHSILFTTAFLILTTYNLSLDHILLPRKNSENSQKVFYQEVMKSLKPGISWAVYKDLPPALPFYGKGHVLVFNDAVGLASFFKSQEEVYCIIPKEYYGELEVKLPFRLIGKLPHKHVLVANKQENPFEVRN